MSNYHIVKEEFQNTGLPAYKVYNGDKKEAEFRRKTQAIKYIQEQER